MDPGHDAATADLRAFTEELVRAGMRDVVICPGSRSTPLALALAAHAGLRAHVLIDERSAGFVALGMARATRRPVAVLVTSGTAAAELLPAVVEASLARVPLLLLTADRPAELRDRGAPQAIAQLGIFGSHVRWATELPIADGSAGSSAHGRWVAGRAVAMATSGALGPGPVHVNTPFREPLIPAGPLGAWPGLPDAPFVRAMTGRRSLEDADLHALAERLATEPCGLIVAGPADEPGLPAAVAALGAATGYPILADPLSGLRADPMIDRLVLARADQLCRPGPWIDDHRPGLVIRFGAMPTSKPVVELLARVRPEVWIVDGDAGWRESALVPAMFLHADAPETARQLAERLAVRGSRARADGGWAGEWLDADRRVDVALRTWLDGLAEPFEGLPFPVLADVLPDGSTIWVGSSMPVRDLDGWLPSTPRDLRVLSGRGANGIDGVTSSAIGAATVASGPTVLVTGDVSFLHDLGALVSARLLAATLTVVLVDNDGGGIFSFLPQATADRPDVGLPAEYERLFGTPHGVAVGQVVEALGFRHAVVDHRGLAAATRATVGDRSPGVRVLTMHTDRTRNVALHRDAAAIAAAALRARTAIDVLVASALPAAVAEETPR